MGNIVLLDDLTINKIAAGEVIERPASVVKEMVENSIDAGADKITVEIKNGGISYIRVTDNGKGIRQDDLEIAFERHATSKIRSAKDLDEVTSMGFRGEALASIAAVSKIELISKTKEQDCGYKVNLKAGDVIAKEETASSTGTSITVTDLFFNTPVRYKFLKKDYTESGYIEDVITRIALVNPNIAIKLINSGKTIIQTSGNGDLKTVIYSIYGKDVADGVLKLDYESDGIKVEGVIGKPEIARSNRINQLFFVNKRYVKDKTLMAATEQAYKGLIPIGKFGFTVLNLEINPSKVDVNVHPAKLEVRFQEENKIFQAVYHSIKDTLLKNDLVANTAKNKAGGHTTLEKNNFNARDKSFEERLAEKLAQKEKEKTNKGLFGFNRQSKKIEQYNDEESKIKTNNIIEDVYNSKADSQTEFKEQKQINEDKGLNTSDVLMELKKMQDELEKDIDHSHLNNEDKQSSINIEELLEKNGYAEVPKLSEEELQKKVDALLSNADAIKAKNNKILQREYNPLEEIKNRNLINNTNVEPYKELEKIEESVEEEEKDDSKKVEDEEEEFNSVDIQLAENDQERQDEENENYENDNKVELPKAFINLQNKMKSEVKEESQQPFDENINEELKKEEKLINIDNNEIQESNLDDSIDKELKQKTEKLEYIKGKINQITENPNVVTEDFKEMYAKLFGTVPKTEEDIEKEQKEKEEKQKINATDIVNDNITLFEEEEEYEIPKYTFIGIAFKTYIIIEMNDELYILDQHAAHERIMYEKVKANFYNETQKDSQMLLLPDVITLTHKEMDIAKDNRKIFFKAGFDFEEFGENTIKVTGVPTVCIDLETKELFLETLDQINTVARTAKQEKEEKFIATVACKAAVKAHMALTEDEVTSLMNDLLKLPNPFTCPHGRPTAIKMTKYDIEKKFNRK